MESPRTDVPAPPTRTGPRSAALVLVLLVGCLPAAAQSGPELPNGLPWGKWIVAPYIQAGYETDDNIFRVRESGSQAPQSDQILTLLGGVLAHLPFRNSLLSLDYEAEYRDYAKNDFSRDLTQTVGAAVDFNFSSFDRLTFEERYVRGITEIQDSDPGGERVFTGQPYNYNRAGFEVAREVAGRPGYTVNLTRTDLNYVLEPGEESVFFDYRGFEGALEYRHPLPGSRWLLAHYDGRRFDHFRVELASGRPYREESWDAVSLGVQGMLGRRQPFYARIGVGEFSYGYAPIQYRPDLEFRGITAEMRLRLTVGAKSGITFGFVRRPLPSNFETYYIINELRVEADRRWLRSSRFGVRALYSRNSYGDEDNDVKGREDTRVRLETYVDWFFHSKIGIRVSASHTRRRSSTNVADYDATVVSSGFRFGWF